MNSAKRIYHVLSRRARKIVFKKTGFDFKNGFHSSENDAGKYYLAFDAEDYFGIDARGVWEHNRFQKLLPNAIEFLKTGDQEIAVVIVEEIERWIDENPFGYGLNWLCAMEVGIRVANWLLVWRLIAGKISHDGAFYKKFLKSIGDHWLYIEQNLEVTFKSPLANHYLSDIAGLLYIALLHPVKQNKTLLKKSARQLEEQIQLQIFDDGVAFENSVAYHRYVVEIFFYSALLLREAGIEFSADYWKRLEKMLEFTLYYTRPDGMAPGFGDSDDGLWHTFFKNEKVSKTDHRYLLSLAAVVFNRADFKKGGAAFYPEFEAVFKFYTVKAWEKIQNISGTLSSRAFKNGGLYVLRHNNLFLAVIAANSDTHFQQLHKHNDIGSFELCVDESPFIVDSGTYCYTSEPNVREQFRSTMAHNTLAIDGNEQQSLRDAGFFAMPRTANVQLKDWKSDNEFDMLSISYTQLLKNGAESEITRTVLFKKGERLWRIEDVVEGNGEHELLWSFHLHPEAKAIVTENVAEIWLRGRILKIIFPENGIQFAKADISFAFGRKQPSHVLRFLKKAVFPYTGIFELQVI